MENITFNIILGIFITITPFFIYNYQKIKTTSTQIMVWGICSFLLCILGLTLSHKDIHLLALITSILFSTLLNYFMIKNWIHIKQLPKTLGILLLFFASTFFQLIPIYLFSINLENLSASQQLYLTLFSDCILFLIFLFIYQHTLKEDFQKLKKNLYQILDIGIKYWLIGLIIMVMSNLFINIFLPQATAGNEESVQELIHASQFISVLAIGFLAPIIEEFTFRKAFRNLFSSKIVYVLASGLIFGGLHVILSLTSPWDLFYIIPYSALGIAFGYMYVKTDNIYTSIIMHIFHNTCLTAFALLGVIL